MGNWGFYIADWETGTLIGELINARNRKITYGVSRNPTLTCEVDFDNPVFEELVEEDPDTAKLLIAYRFDPAVGEKVVKYAGPVLSVEDVAEKGGASVALSSMGAGWRFGKVIANNDSNNGFDESGIFFDVMERGQILQWAIKNRLDRGINHWIRAEIGDQAPSSKIEIKGLGGFTSLSAMIEQISQGAQGIEWWIDPAFTTDAYGLKLGNFKSAPTIGEDKTGSVIFEYGIGRKNCSKFERKSDYSHILNRAYHAVSGGSPYYTVSNNTRSRTRLGILEEVTPVEITDPELRQEWVDLNTAVRSTPRREYSFVSEPVGFDDGNYIPLIDVQVGDRVLARAYYADKLRVNNAIMRVWSIEINIRDDGTEEVTYGLTQE